MGSAGGVLRRWGFPAGGALAVAALIGFNLGGVSRPVPDPAGPTPAPTPAPTSAPAPEPGPGSPVAASTGGSGDDNYRACRTEAPSWQTTARAERVFTHVTTLTLAPGVQALELDVDSVEVLRSAVTFTSGDPAPVTADQVLRTVRSQHRIRIADVGSATSSTTRRVSVPAHHLDSDRVYVGFSGRVVWSGDWSYGWCADHFWHTTRGRWSSYGVPATDGLALCRLNEQDLAGRYPARSWDRRACRNS